MLILFGATGYTGAHAARALRDHAPPGLRWGLAARSHAKLLALRDSLGPSCAHVPLLQADVSDPASIDAMVAQARVIATTVGPYARYGTPVVDACIRHRVHYCDITGETPWVRDLIDAHHETATNEHTRIVPCCGMDSVPSDLGAMFVAREIRRRFGTGCSEVRCALKFKGGVSGGTIASMLHMGATGQARRLADPLLLNQPADRSDAAKRLNRDQVGARYDADLGTWTAPFVMAPVNTRVVRRSASLESEWGTSYGAGFRYSEAMATRGRARAVAATASMAALAAGVATPVGRAVIGRLTPDPGHGPSDAELERGFMHYRFAGVAEDGERLIVELQASGDPGYKVTITMLVQAALCLALDGPSLPGGPGRGGVLTPATALGAPYLERLQRAGIALRVVEG